MDYFSHGIWSYIFFHRIDKPYLAVLFGLLPDTLSWVIYFVYSLFTKGYQAGPPVVAEIPKWVFMLYNISHSLIIALLIFGIVFIVLRKIPLFMYAWPVAIIMDVFTHTRDFLPTPFLWPLSDWAFPGISWGSRWFVITNYSLIVIALAVIIVVKRSKR